MYLVWLALKPSAFRASSSTFLLCRLYALFWSSDILAGSQAKKEIAAAVKKDTLYKSATSKRHAYREVAEEIGALTDAQRADLSDIFERATDGRVNGGWGHGKSYWDSGNLALAKGAFAEFCSAQIGSPESLAILRQYLPKLAEVFKDIIEAIEKGTI